MKRLGYKRSLRLVSEISVQGLGVYLEAYWVRL